MTFDCAGAPFTVKPWRLMERKKRFVRNESQWRAFKQRLEEKNTQPKWYEQSGEWDEAKKLGITDGTRPEDKATRAEVAAMVLRAKKLEARP